MGVIGRDIATALSPTPTQVETLLVLGLFTLLFLMYPFGYYLLFPFRMVVTALHEFSHAFVAVLVCHRVHYIEIHPDSSGLTSTSGRGTLSQAMICSAGYLGSAFIGAALVFCGFDTYASKIVTLVLAGIFAITLFWARRDWLTWVTTGVTAGIVVACWLVDHGRALRYLVLLLGVLSCSWSLKDTFDIMSGRVSEGSDAHSICRFLGGTPQMWAFLWSLISLAFFVTGILLGLWRFKETDLQMIAESNAFLPT